jgi:acyl carrier protein
MINSPRDRSEGRRDKRGEISTGNIDRNSPGQETVRMSEDTGTDFSAVRRFINTELLYWEDQPIDHTANLIESGVIDSINLVRLIEFLEEHYGIEIPDEDIVVDNFHSLDSIEAFVASHMKRVQ